MGALEKKTTQRSRREKIQQKIAIMLFRFSTRNGWLAFAPEEQLRRRLFPESTPSATRRLWQAVRRLEGKGLVEWRVSEKGRQVALTDKGRVFARRAGAADLLAPRPKKWDGKWRIVMFDIWESRRLVRDKLRAALEKAGFRRIQNSVWVSPYDGEDLLVFLKADLRLGGGVVYLIAEGIENDLTLRRWFGL